MPGHVRDHWKLFGFVLYVVPFTPTSAHPCLGDKIEQAYAFIAQ